MKAKHFKKIREQVQYFRVYQSGGLFGEFWSTDSYELILAKTPENAVLRWQKRIYHRQYDIRQTGERFGKFKVLPDNKPFNRFITYWN